MSEHFDARWKRLVAAARRAPVPGPRAARRGWVEQVARRALLARTTSSVRAREPLAWAGLVSLAAAAAIAVLVWPGPVTSTACALASGAGALPRSVPHAPRLPRSPPAPRPPLPSREAAVAAVSRLPELGVELELPLPPTPDRDAMNFADILFWFLMVAGAYLALNAYWLAAVALFRPAVERARLTYATRPVGATLAGLLALIPVALVFIVFARAAHPGVKLVAGALLMVPLVLALLGSAGLADKIGAGLATPVDEAQPWRRVLRGGAVLALLFVVPLLGWFAVFPLTLASGLGALLLPRRPVPAAEPAVPRLGKPPLQVES